MKRPVLYIAPRDSKTGLMNEIALGYAGSLAEARRIALEELPKPLPWPAISEKLSVVHFGHSHNYRVMSHIPCSHSGYLPLYLGLMARVKAV